MPKLNCSFQFKKNVSDQMSTIPSPKKIANNKNFASAWFQAKKQISSFVLGSKILWNQSAMSKTRSRSPQHKIPKAERFASLYKQTLKNRQFLTLSLQKKINEADGISFAKAIRKDPFRQKGKQQFPSPNSYQLSNTISIKTSRSGNKNSDISKTFTQSFYQKNLIKRGRTISKFSNYQKLYLPQGKNMLYQAQVTKQNPGVGKYDLSPQRQERLKKNCFTMAKRLPMFNQQDNMHPGPGTYIKIHYATNNFSPFNNGIMTKSKRTYLSNPQNEQPGPSDYKIKRFCE